jgi:tetratricopeptide (TPR) repeat protein
MRCRAGAASLYPQVVDSLISAAARALAAGDALQALKHVALRDDPPALALRGIAMAQLGELVRARDLLRRALRGLGPQDKLARARCIVAEAEAALAMRDFSASPRVLEGARDTLEACGDSANALLARLIAARHCLLLGRLDEAAAGLAPVDVDSLPPLLQAVASLTSAELALRRLMIPAAQVALERAQAAAGRADVPALQAEVVQTRAALDRPAARRWVAGGWQLLRLHEVAALMESGELVIDACRHGLRAGAAWLPLARRPILFALLRALAEAWPAAVDRETLIERAFRQQQPDETHRARLRVEIGRLRSLVAGYAAIEATARGFVVVPRHGRRLAVLAPPIEGDQGELVALLSDGTAWSTSALALALGESQRTVQRSLAELELSGRVRAVGQTRARRWLAPPLIGFTTMLLLPTALPPG